MFKVGEAIRIIDGCHNTYAMDYAKSGQILTVSKSDDDFFWVAENPRVSFRNARAERVMVPVVVAGRPPIPTEVDPAGKVANEPGAKLDAGKVMAAQILSQFPRALLGVAEVGTFGAKKYSLGGWLEVPNGIARYADAKVRHWLARARGEEVDTDSKLDHLKHEAWNVLAELELTLKAKESK